ncbi:GntR family transcriptional regulator [Microbacterium sp. YY-01]|uniref:GntR family transcriptional regulator n=1 Tax=Microbacterium sp. YY-01 TaxID=3421634 RepID=UPI003D17BCDF
MSESAAARIEREATGVNLREEVESLVGAAIVSGELAPGTLVSVPSLAAQYSVSATPVREAMVNLQKRGFVEPVRNRGFRVTAVSDRDIYEVTVLRAWLEVPAMREVAHIFPHDRIREFRQMADDIVMAVDEGDLTGYLQADADFHSHILTILDNQRLIETVTNLRQETRMTGLAALLGTPQLRRTASEHHLILDLLLDGDADGVAELVHSHIVGHLHDLYPETPAVTPGTSLTLDD